MTYRWMLSEDAGATFTIEVRPTVDANLFDWVADNNNSIQGKRLQIATNLKFNGDDYKYLLARRNSAGFCGSVPIRFELKCGSQWVPLWNGVFPVGGGGWNYPGCSFTTRPKSDGVVACVKAKSAIRQNILSPAAVNIKMTSIAPGLEFGAIGFPITDLDGPAWEEVGLFEVDMPSGYETCISAEAYTVFWREITYTECVDGEIVAPNTFGWTMIEAPFDHIGEFPTCETEGRTKWAREPSLAWPWTDTVLTAGTLVPSGEPLVPPSEEGCGGWLLIQDLQCGDDHVGLYICVTNAESYDEFPHGRRLDVILKYLVEKMECGVAGIKSDFFGIDAPGDAPGYESGINYATGRSTLTEDIVMLHKTDALDPTATQPATKGDMSFKDLQAALSAMFKTGWFIDEDGYIRVEHCSYRSSVLGMDLTAMPVGSVVEPQFHDSLNEEVPNIERLLFLEAFGLDYVGADVIYSGPCVESLEQKEVEYTAKDVMTDIIMILTEPELVSRKGFVMLATVVDGDDHSVLVDIGAITNTPSSNAPLSTANLMKDYWQHDRFLRLGNMNGEDVEFINSKPNIRQANVKVLCKGCDILNFDPDKLVRTRLGTTRLGDTLATVERASLDVHGHLSLELRYSV
jgi:hypothetical protein